MELVSTKGKHIVCIDASPSAAAIQTLVGANPEPRKETGKYRGQGEPAEREDTAKTDNKRKMVAMRFRERDHAAIKKKAARANMSFTEFVTAAALDKPFTVIDGLGDVLREQKAIGRNLNQLTTLCNMGKITCPDLRGIKDQYAAVMTALEEIARRCRS